MPKVVQPERHTGVYKDLLDVLIEDNNILSLSSVYARRSSCRDRQLGKYELLRMLTSRLISPIVNI